MLIVFGQKVNKAEENVTDLYYPDWAQCECLDSWESRVDFQSNSDIE